MDRRKFIARSGLAALALTTFGQVVKAENGRFAGDCTTTDDILGPFYRPDAPIRKSLITPGLTGHKILLSGTVFSHDCVTPAKDALVEIWHCNTKGEYDNESDGFHQRAAWKTGKKGNYEFATILPGKYLNGRKYRPAHIHFRVTAPGHQELISQVYFRGDPHIEEDPWASQSKAELRILELFPGDTHGNLMVSFDVYLAAK